MFLSDKLLYAQMQKTGCSHLTELFSSFLEGKTLRKHRIPGKAHIKSDRLKASSIRNPWNWYLSLWSYGVSDRGGFRGRVERRGFSAKRFISGPGEELGWLQTKEGRFNLIFVLVEPLALVEVLSTGM